MKTSGGLLLAVLSLLAHSAATAADKTWTGAVNDDWHDDGNWSPPGVPAAGDTINISINSPTADPPVTIHGTLNWSGASLVGGLTIASDGVMNISGSAAGLDAALTNAGTINWSSAAHMEVFNLGAFPYTGSIHNLAGGQFNIQNDGYSIYNHFELGSTGYFVNAGTVRKTSGTGASYLNLPFTQTGTVQADTGTLYFALGGEFGGSYVTGAGAVITLGGGEFTMSHPAITGAGTTRFDGGALTLLDEAPPGLLLAGGTVYLGPAFQGGSITNLTLAGSVLSGDYTVSGTCTFEGGFSGNLRVAGGATLDWKEGSLLGALTIATNGVMNISGSAVAMNAALTNAGTINWSSAAHMEVFNLGAFPYTGCIHNLAGGQFNIQNDGYSIYNNFELGSTGYFVNAGTVRKTSGTGASYLNLPFTQTGTVQADTGTLYFALGGEFGGSYVTGAGAVITLGGGEFTMSHPAITGAGTTRFDGGALTLLDEAPPGLLLAGGTVYLGPAFQGGSITNLTLAGSVLSGDYTVSGTCTFEGGFSGNLRVAGGATLDWKEGSLLGALTIATNGVMNISGSAVAMNAALTNAGTINWSSAAHMEVFNLGAFPYTGCIHNLAGGQFNIQNDGYSIYNNFELGSTGYFINAGTVRKTSGTGASYLNLPFTQTGTVQADAGTLYFALGGEFGGSYVTGAGAVITLGGGEFTMSHPAITGAGTTRFDGGALTLLDEAPPGLLLAGGTVYLGPAFQGGSITNLTLAGSVLSGDYTVSGTCTFEGGFSGNLRVAGGATLDWKEGSLLGALTIAANGVMNISGQAVAMNAALTNAGTINWSSAANMEVFNLGAFPYTGSIHNLAGGQFNIQNDGYSIYNHFELGSTGYFVNAGTVRKYLGTGTSYLNLPFTQTGTVQADTGTIVFQAAYTENSAATLAFSLGGLALGSGYGHIHFTSPPILNGAFTVSTRNGFRPNPGDTFDVLSYPSFTNDFTCFSGFDLGGGLWLQPQLRRTGLTLTATTYATNGLPSLFAVRSPGGVRVFWTLGFPDWELVSTTNLFQPQWTPVPAMNCDHQVVLPVTLREQYFQLRKSN